MFILRKAQITAFQQAAVTDFEERMAAHLREIFPHEAADRGVAALRALIRRGIDRAARHDIHQEYGACLYLHLMLALGEQFDDDPKIPWARAALTEPDLDASLRIERLHDRVFAQDSTADGTEEGVRASE